VINVPLNPAFSSLNLAQAVLLIGYEWFVSGDATPPSEIVVGDGGPGSKANLLQFFAHLEEELDRNGFLRNTDKRPSMVRNLRNIFQRAACTEQELRTLHGLITAFAGARKRK
jgi:tRNA/rRNA methyltransferase